MNPLNLFRKSRGSTAVPQAHMTFARTSAARTIMRTGTILKKQVWLWPIIAVVVLAIVGVGVSSAIRTTMKSSFQSQLQTLLNVETSMLETWLKTQGAGAETQRGLMTKAEGVGRKRDRLHHSSRVFLIPLF